MTSRTTKTLPPSLARCAITSLMALAALGSCNVFDADLYKDQPDPEVGTENWAVVGDACPLPKDDLLTSDTRVHSGVVSLNDLADDYQDIGKLTDVDGPDGVLAFRVAADERVAIDAEFEVPKGQSAPPVDLALWLVQGCDTNKFVRRNERCPEGIAEPLWWQTGAPDEFQVGLDSRSYDQDIHAPQVRLTVTYPRFGDGKLDAGEACDDGNLIDGDGCSHDGLAEIVAMGSNPVQEVEPNNHPPGANVVIMGVGETMQIVGYIGGSCDLDFFAMDVPEGSFPRVTVLGADGKDCPEGTPEFKLQFNHVLGNNQEQAKLGDAKIPAVEGTGTNHCPQFDETSFAVGELEAGRYLAEFKPFDKGQHEAFHYLVKIEMLDPM